MRLLYNIVFAVFFLLSLPYYGFQLWRRGNWKAGFRQRFGLYSAELAERLRGGRVIWLHAVSVGEANLCALLTQRLSGRLKGWTIVASTTTTTGMGELQRKLPDGIVKVYYPVDFSWTVNRALRAIHPKLVVLIEAEIWPNFLWRLAEMQVPAFLVNARLSDRSAKGYRYFRPLFQPIFANLAGVGVQDKQDARILESAGCSAARIQVTGNLKFDAAHLATGCAMDTRPLIRRAGAKANALILLGSSTHAGEERLLGEIFLRLRRDFRDLFMVIVPRHFERSAEVHNELAALGIQTKLRSGFEPDSKAPPSNPPASGDCLIVDSTGELRFFYRAASVVVIGKSFLARGGQNPIEAAAVGCPIVVGPFMENFRAIVQTFLAKGGIVQTHDAAGLGSALRSLLADESRRRELGRRAQAVVRENQGAVERSIAMMAPCLEELSG